MGAQVRKARHALNHDHNKELKPQVRTEAEPTPPIAAPPGAPGLEGAGRVSAPRLTHSAWGLPTTYMRVIQEEMQKKGCGLNINSTMLPVPQLGRPLGKASAWPAALRLRLGTWGATGGTQSDEHTQRELLGWLHVRPTWITDVY